MNHHETTLREAISVRLIGAGVILCLGLVAPGSGMAQENSAGNGTATSRGREGNGSPGDPSPSLAQQLEVLRAQVAQLEAALKQKHAGQSNSASPATGGKMSGKGRGGGKGMGGKTMGMAASGMKKGMGEQNGGGMGMMPPGMGMDMMQGGMSGSGGMGMMPPGMGMMGRMKGTGQMQMPSSLPGYPGASHIYHIGATGFFLDHTDHITLTPDQQATLNKLKESALLAQSTFDRQIEESEQQLWVLTGSDSPDAIQITARVGEIAKLTAEKRIAFIRAVGEAAGALTEEQRLALIGMLPPEHTAAKSQTTPDQEDE